MHHGNLVMAHQSMSWHIYVIPDTPNYSTYFLIAKSFRHNYSTGHSALPIFRLSTLSFHTSSHCADCYLPRNVFYEFATCSMYFLLVCICPMFVEVEIAYIKFCQVLLWGPRSTSPLQLRSHRTNHGLCSATAAPFYKMGSWIYWGDVLHRNLSALHKKEYQNTDRIQNFEFLHRYKRIETLLS